VASVVTGAAGFLGRSLVGLLLARGEPVVGIDRQPVPARPGLTVLAADLAEPDPRVREALATADRVFHLAAVPGVRDRVPPWIRYRDNVQATELVLAAVPARTPLVFTSSSSVYGGSAGGRPSTEHDPLRPRGGYARSKVAAEARCRARLAAGGRVVIARPFTVAGPHQRPDMALARWIDAVARGRPVRIFGSPHRTRDVTDVAQVAQVLVGLADRGARGTVNVGTGTGHTLAALVAAVGAALDLPVRTELVPAHPDEVPDTLADPARLRRLLGWVPRTDLPALVARQVAASAAARPQPELAGRP
jgi:nucleoside-diphosphate-sugar epimerase